MGPSGSAAVFEENESVVYSYLPMRDLEEKSWDEIFSAVKNILKEIGYEHL